MARQGQETEQRDAPSVLFDLDGTLLDSAYEHVMAWREALEAESIYVPHVRIHRCIGMSGKLMLRTIFRELGHKAGERKIERLETLHKKAFKKRLSSIRVLPGARELLRHLSAKKIAWAIASSGDKQTVREMVKLLRVPSNAPIITGDHVERAKPDPDVFFEAAAQLGVALSKCIVVGDSVWDLLAARRAKALGVAVLCGGYGEEELIQAGAYRIYRDPRDLLENLAEVGIQ